MKNLGKVLTSVKSALDTIIFKKKRKSLYDQINLNLRTGLSVPGELKINESTSTISWARNEILGNNLEQPEFSIFVPTAGWLIVPSTIAATINEGWRTSAYLSDPNIENYKIQRFLMSSMGPSTFSAVYPRMTFLSNSIGGNLNKPNNKKRYNLFLNCTQYADLTITDKNVARESYPNVPAYTNKEFYQIFCLDILSLASKKLSAGGFGSGQKVFSEEDSCKAWLGLVQFAKIENGVLTSQSYISQTTNIQIEINIILTKLKAHIT